jgi:AAA domain, putative AbiEii toxin, Type IV TA system
VLRDELHAMIYLGPLRQTPQRNSEPPMSKEPGRWATGLAAWDLLKNGDDALVNEASFWLFRDECLNTGYAIKVRKLRELDEESPLMVQLRSERAFDNIDDLKEELDRLPQRRRLVLIERRTALYVDPEDVGEGIAQIVPVVVAALSSTSGLIAIEQSELHVHPRVQVALGDVFIARVNKQRPKDITSSFGIRPGSLLIETHSEHLLLRQPPPAPDPPGSDDAHGRKSASEVVGLP